ncbi:serine hydrolase [Lyngbya aestuarii]|uniref:serine hydrolase n=1 Tax=Lyngbya aestuarii TaxID=118322 RepID=UPI00403DFC4F
MAASMDKRRQSKKLPGEQRVEPIDPRSLQRRNHQKQQPRPEVRSRRYQQQNQASGERVQPILPKKLTPQNTEPPTAANIPPRLLRPLPPAPIDPNRPKVRAVDPARIRENSHMAQGRKRRIFSEKLDPRRSQPLTNSEKMRRNRQRSSNTADSVPRATAQAGHQTSRQVNSGFGSPSPRTKKSRRSRRRQERPPSLLGYILRLLVVGIGISTIVGTVLSALNPATQTSLKANDTPNSQVQESPGSVSNSTPLALRQEISPLKAQIQTLMAQNPALEPGVFVLDLDTGAYLEINSNSTFAAASTIKVPVLVAFFQAVDAGVVRLDELLTLQQEAIADGSGDLQYQKPGTQYTALEVIEKMITISDNTATNMIINRLGGTELLNQQFLSWGLTTTAIQSPLPDIQGTNTTSPKDMAYLMSIVNQGKLLSLRSRDRLLDIMQQTKNDSLLPKGLGADAVIAHKTGNIGSVIADVGLVDMPTGKRYIVAVIVKRPRNDPSAEELIRQISGAAYDYFQPPRATPSTNLVPSGSTATLTSLLNFEVTFN